MTLPPAGPAVTHSIGRVDHPPTYFEMLTPATGSTKPPVVMIHGGAHTGACYRDTGRPPGLGPRFRRRRLPGGGTGLAWAWIEA